MEIIDPSTINYAPYNPRKMSEHDGKALEQSMTKFGDVSGITSNRQTGNYVTGHQRMRTLQAKFPGRVKIQVDQQLEQPDEYGTVALGFVFVEGTNLRFAYRQVDWTLATEKVVNVAANRIEADWEQEMLAEINQELAAFDNGEELLEMTGQTDKEIQHLNKMFGPDPDGEEQPDEQNGDPHDGDKLVFALTTEQREVVEEALGHIKATREMPTEQNGSQNGSALYYMARDYLDRLHGLKNEPTEPTPAAPAIPSA